jgi:hypothetical protein
MSSHKQKDEPAEGIHRSIVHIENDVDKLDAQGESIDEAGGHSPINKLHDESILASPVSNHCCCHPSLANTAHNHKSDHQ